MGFISKFLSGAASMLGLNKNNKGGLGGLLNKAKSFVSSGLSALNSSPVRKIVSYLSPQLPGVGEVFTGLKKYGNIANNVLNGGAQNFSERFIKNSPALTELDRWDKKKTIEKKKHERNPEHDDMGLNSLFN